MKSKSESKCARRLVLRLVRRFSLRFVLRSMLRSALRFALRLAPRFSFRFAFRFALRLARRFAPRLALRFALRCWPRLVPRASRLVVQKPLSGLSIRRLQCSRHRLRMQRFVGSQTSCGSAERPAAAWQLKDVQRWLKQQHLQCSSHDMCNAVACAVQ